jgi:hypothetical protein
MKNDPKRIRYESGDEESWICICGNKPLTDGFSPCDAGGNEMSPDIGSDWQNLYVCLTCGRVIRGDTLDVIGQNSSPKVLA